MTHELAIANGNRLYLPIVADGVEWTTERRGVPGKLTFTAIKDAKLDFEEGNHVRYRVNDHDVFYGFVFTKRRNKDHEIEVTAYDQLRYLVNKDTKKFENMTASDIIQQLASEFGLQAGELDKTTFINESLVQMDTSLFDMIAAALDLELKNRGNMFVMYDDFGRITLRNIENMRLKTLIDSGTAEDFDYTSTIDENTYNRVKLQCENKETGMNDTYVVQDGSNINRWGLLQYYGTLQEGENGDVKAANLLELYNAKTRKLRITKAIGDLRVRAGCLLPVILNIGDMMMQNFMLCEKVTHEFEDGAHFMNIDLRGNGFDS